MFKMVLLGTAAVAFAAASALFTAGGPWRSRPALWAAVGVSKPLFREGQTKDLRITFALVNDGVEALDPEIASSEIIVNGAALRDSGFILGNGPKPLDWKALPPGGSLEFGYALGEYFGKPGTYRVAWKGKNFEARPVDFRVMPADGK
jgi:hypothetical protein